VGCSARRVAAQDAEDTRPSRPRTTRSAPCPSPGSRTAAPAGRSAVRRRELERPARGPAVAVARGQALQVLHPAAGVVSGRITRSRGPAGRPPNRARRR
jgi:hypothetical protein